MTGRRLYEKYTDSLKACAWYYGATTLPNRDVPPSAWPFLSDRDQRVWNDLARRLAPRRKKVA